MRGESPAGASGACPACLWPSLTPWGEKDGFPISRCTRCGGLSTPPARGADLVAALYEHYYDRATFGIPAAARLSLDRLVRSAEQFRRNGCWLDVGFGEGALLTLAEAHGWSCYGTEVSARALEFGRERGWYVTREPHDDARFVTAGCDVVTLIELLEHVQEPRVFLRDAARWLRPGGLLYATTPNAWSLNRWLLGSAWSVVSPPEHLSLWTPSGIRRALVEHGFSVRRIRCEGLNPFEILRHLHPARASQSSTSRNESGFAMNEALSVTPSRRRLKALANAGLSLMRLGDTLKVWAVRTP